MQLIRKGGFRERANRHSRFEESENKQRQLQPRHYANNDQIDTTQAEIQNNHLKSPTPHLKSENK